MHSSTTTLTLPEKAARFVESEFKKHDTSSLYYHNLKHTQEVVAASRTIAEGINLSSEEQDILITAAWFHDVGHVHPERNPIEASIDIARSYLTQEKASDDFINGVIGCIEATDMPQNPDGLLQQIICDADMAHLASKEYEFWAEALRKERKVTTNEKIKKSKWNTENLKFFKKHEFFTDFAKSHFGPKKQKNYLSLKAKIASEKKKSDKPTKVPKGGEIMYRIVMRTHMDLSAIADTKANIMISVNAILLSILVTVLFRRIEEYTAFWLPGVILTMVCLLTIVFAILATLPQVTQGRFRKEDVLNNRANLLFFGNFYNMTRDDFEWGMQIIRQNDDLAYGSLTRDLYNLGRVLARKYKMLRFSYLIFVIGLVISIVSFIIVASGRANVM
ncbi:MAG: Pycsar system effector family protein [Cyclobacteriaceae bacterium]